MAKFTPKAYFPMARLFCIRKQCRNSFHMILYICPIIETEILLNEHVLKFDPFEKIPSLPVELFWSYRYAFSKIVVEILNKTCGLYV